jgi:hypothetical protein
MVRSRGDWANRGEIAWDVMNRKEKKRKYWGKCIIV